MIARHWRGLAKAEFANAYISHLKHETFPALHKLGGFEGASILRRNVSAGVEFLIVTHWQSLDHIRAFAGQDIEAAVVPEAVQKMMVHFDSTARHYDVCEPSLPSAAVVFVDDVAKLSAFYQAIGGMALLHGDAQHAVLARPGLQLTIHAIRRSADQPAGKYDTREDGHVKLCLAIDSIARARETAKRFGGEVWPVEKEWNADDRGFRACDGRDPEGNVFQVREPRVG